MTGTTNNSKDPLVIVMDMGTGMKTAGMIGTTAKSKAPRAIMIDRGIGIKIKTIGVKD